MAARLTINVPHDCNLHHLDIPVPEILIPDAERRAAAPNDHVLTPNSYDARELGRAINDIVGFRRGSTSRQSELIYEFVADYLSTPSIDVLSLQEFHDFYNNLMVQIDKYFFQGGLTQGPAPHVRLVMFDQPHMNIRGNIQGYWKRVRHVATRLVIFARKSSTGKRRSKLDLLNTLVHELAHAYLGVFFNFCPVRGQSNLVLDNKGHGEIWQQVYHGIMIHMRTWHPSLLELGVDIDTDIGDDTLVWHYYDLLGKIPWLRQEWDVTNLRWYEPNILRLWWWKRIPLQPMPKEEFKRALLKLSYEDYTHFVSMKVPYPATLCQVLFRNVLIATVASMVSRQLS